MVFPLIKSGGEHSFSLLNPLFLTGYIVMLIVQHGLSMHMERA